MRLTRTVLAIGAAIAVLPSTAPAVSCRAPLHLVEVTSAKKLTCRQAVRDLHAYTDIYATTFSTPGGYSCRIISRRSARETVFRCGKGSRAYRFEFFGRLPNAIRISAAQYDKTFKVTSCKGSDPLELSFRGYTTGGFDVTIGNGKLFIDGGDEEDGVALEAPSRPRASAATARSRPPACGSRAG
jgi:hypothetical protein